MSYGFTCGYCLDSFECQTEDDNAAHAIAQDNGWRMTFGDTPYFDGFAHVTCPSCCSGMKDDDLVSIA